MAAKVDVFCPLCQGKMVKSSVGNAGGIALGCFLLLLGLILSVVLFPLGLLIGVPLVIYSLTCGGKRVWRCKNCGHWLPR